MYLLRKNIYFTLFFVLSVSVCSNVFAQETPGSETKVPMPELGPNDTIPVPAKVIGNEIVPGGNLEWVWVQVPYPKELLRRRQEWTRLRNAVYVTYPYARKAAFIINDINYKLATIPNKGDHIDQPTRWRSGRTIAELKDQTVRIKFLSQDADLYSIGVLDRKSE